MRFSFLQPWVMEDGLKILKGWLKALKNSTKIYKVTVVFYNNFLPVQLPPLESPTKLLWSLLPDTHTMLLMGSHPPTAAKPSGLFLLRKSYVMQSHN